jgi:hypothetical protein
MPEGKGTYGSQRGRPPMKRLSETDTKGSLLSKFKNFMSLKNVNKRVQEAAKTPSREQVKLQDFKSAFAKAKKAGKKTFMFQGKEFTTKTRDEAVKAFQRLISKHGSSPEQVEKSAREIRVSHGIPHPKKNKKKSK